jgi:hypothetical protein
VALAIAAIAWAGPAPAQQSVDVASLSGRVTDSSGAVVPGAQVSARQTDTNVTSTATTDTEGRFRFPYLRVGPYDVVVDQPGFQEAKRGLTLTVGAAFEVPFVLNVAGVDASVTVTADVTVLDVARSQIATTVARAEVEHLPMNGRQFLDLALITPAVAPANVGSTQLFPETSAVPGASLLVGSQRNLSNNFIVDGLSANDDAAALSGITYSVDAIDQFQVVTSGAQAELGRALGGYINVVTRSGTNVVHGTAYDFMRHDRLNAANPLSGSTLPMRQSQFGGSLGGPIVSNRTFYFGNVEQRRLDQSGFVTISPPTVDAINARLRAVGYQGPLVSTGTYPSPVDSTNFFSKVDHTVNSRDQLSVRYSLYDVTADNSRGAGGLSAPSASSALDNRDQAVAVSNTFSLAARTVLETRGQVAHGDLQAPPTDPTGPAVNIAGIASFGRLSNSPTGRVNTLYQVVNNVSHQAGAHALKAGVDFLYNDDRIVFPRAVHGTYGFSSLANFLSGVYNNAGFTQTFGATEVAQTNSNVGMYTQDEWKATPSLTLNLGVRYDLQWLESIHTDTNNVAPRVGVAWSPSESRGTVVRGSAGLFYDRVPLRAVANALLSAGNTTDLTRLRQTSISLSPTQAGAPAFPAVLAAPVPSVTLFSLTTMDRDLQNASSRQASVEIEQQLGDQLTVSAGYQYVRGVNLLMSVNQNVPTCVAAGTNNGCRPVPDYANNSQYSSVGDSNYHGLHFSVVQRPARWGHYRLSYSLSKSMNNVGEFFFSAPIDPGDLSRDWGRSDDDQRHRLVLSGTLQTSAEPASTPWEHITHGFQFSGLVQAYSALPLNITSGVTTVQATGGRPVENGATPTPLDVRLVTFIPRNAGTGNDFFSVNARISRAFRVTGRVNAEALVEAFNLTNRRNAITRNGNFGPGAYPDAPSASFGQILAVSDPRSVQLGVRVRF